MKTLQKLFLNDKLTPNDLLDKIVNSINSSKKIAVVGHIEPDGDAIGSQLALVLSLEQNGWKADAINQGPFNNIFLKKNKKYFKKDIEDNYDLFIIVDTPSIDRIGENIKKIDLARSIVIDHHPTNVKYGSINWVDENFLSTSEMILLLLIKMDIGSDDEEIAQHLLNGIISDSGNYQHIRKDKYFSLLVSYYLIDRGADPKKSYKLLFGKKNLASKKIFALALNRIELLNSGNIAWSYISENDKKKYKNVIEDNAGVYKEMLDILGVEVSVFFKIRKNKINISFRSNGNCDVSKLAEEFGGGGHREASGATLTGTFDRVRNRVLRKASLMVN